MFRRYNRWHSRFDQPDPYNGSYDLTNPQSFNRYAYVGNDPVNFVDPSGLDPDGPRHVRPENPTPNYWWSYYLYGNWNVRQRHYVVEDRFSERGDRDPAPQNTQPPNTKQPDGAACDKKLAGLFGGPGAIADTGRTPSTLPHPSAGNQRFPEHSAEGGVMHLYTNAQGSAASVGLYAPQGFTSVPGGSGTVYYPNKPGQVNAGEMNYNYSQYRNSAGITISFVHIGPPAGSPTNAAGSLRIGSIAGPGGDDVGYHHTHINFYSNFAKGIRVDPRKLFCKEFGF